MVLNHIVLALMWIFYGVLHSVLAGLPVKRKLQKWLGTSYRYYRLFYTILAFVLLVGIVLFQVRMPNIELFQPSTFILVLGAVIGTSGLVLMIICIKNYFMTLSGLRTLYVEEPSTTLIIKGIHLYVRHPLYLGTFAFIWGLFLLYPYLSLLIADVIITVYTLIAIRYEEDKLVLEFGSQYKEYQDTVPKLFPLLNFKRKA